MPKVLELQLQLQHHSSDEYSWLISFRIDWFDLLAIQGAFKSLIQHHNLKASILQCSAFLIVQLSHPYMTTGKTFALTRRTFVGKVMSLFFNTLSRLVIAFLPRSTAPCSGVYSCPALCNHMEHSPAGSSVHRILQARILECTAISYSRDWTHVSCISCAGRQVLLPQSHLGNPRSKCLLISWLQSSSAVILEPNKRKSATTSTFSLSICLSYMENIFLKKTGGGGV